MRRYAVLGTACGLMCAVLASLIVGLCTTWSFANKLTFQLALWALIAGSALARALAHTPEPDLEVRWALESHEQGVHIGCTNIGPDFRIDKVVLQWAHRRDGGETEVVDAVLEPSTGPVWQRVLRSNDEIVLELETHYTAGSRREAIYELRTSDGDKLRVPGATIIEDIVSNEDSAPLVQMRVINKRRTPLLFDASDELRAALLPAWRNYCKAQTASAE